MARQGTVFISSTSEDLKDYRLAARDAVLAAGLRPEMMEYFAASGGPPLSECLDRVSPCDVVVVLVAQRYGWVPPDQPDEAAKSITWLECEHAAQQGKEVLVFLLDAGVPWPTELEEVYRSTAALKDGTFTSELIVEIQRNVAKLKELRRWLETGRTRATFTSPGDVRAKVGEALQRWLDRHPEYRPSQPRRQDPRPYLEWVREQNGTIEIRGLGGGAGKAHNFPIEDLYIPLTTPSEPPRQGADLATSAERQPMELEEALAHRRLVIVGDPGSGKTTFLRRIAFALAGVAIQHPAGVPQEGPASAKTGVLAALRELFGQPGGKTQATGLQALPFFIRIAELCEHVERCIRDGGRQRHLDAGDAGWLVHFLATQNARCGWGLSEEFFSSALSGGSAIVLLDGLDEAPGREEREKAARLFESATRAYPDSRFVVTTRPQTYAGQGVLEGFHEARIEPLTPEAVNTFLERWCRGLYPDSARLAENHRSELSGALSARPEIRRMASNPVMLTALAVVHWNERRLPEQRADLYDAILTWLSRQRERKGREKPERCLTLLGELALAMQNNAGGRQVRVPMEWAAGALAQHFGPAPHTERIQRASEFVEQETADSGIVVKRGGEVQFWHLTFQEYLAAQAIAGQKDDDQVRLLLEQDKIYRSEWREVSLLLAGILLVNQKSKAKVDGLVSAVLDRTEPTLPDQARTAGLLGAMFRDLKPVGYQPSDERYGQLMKAILGIFDREGAGRVDFAVRLEAAEALGQAGDPRLERENWVRIEGGAVRMHGRCQEVVLKAFEIARYPVTVAEYQRFVDGGYFDRRWWKAGGFGKDNEAHDWEGQQEHPNRPVVEVSWFEASAYCAWAGGRLPSESEWERVASGAEGRRYPWGEDEPDGTRANYYETGPGAVTPVGLYPLGATPEGVLDLAGNVWEWVKDASEDGKVRVLRGGSWYGVAASLRTGARGGQGPGDGHRDIGFRVARDVVTA